MALQETPGASFDEELEGEYIYLNFHPQDEKEGEGDLEKFRVNAFKLTKNGLSVALYRKKPGQLFKYTWCDHKEIIPDKQLTMDVIADTLKQALTARADNVKSSVIRCNDVFVLEIRVQEATKLFGKVVVYNFKYKLPLAKLPRTDYVDMRFGEIEKEIALLLKGEDAATKENDKIEAKFVTKDNNNTNLENDGRVIVHTGSTVWNSTPVNFEMTKNEAFRARYRINSHNFNYLMFGVISKSFSAFTSHPTGNGHYGWVAYFYDGKVGTSYQHNGNFRIFSGGPAPFAGSIVTVEFFPQNGIIQYLVNDVPAGRHHGCSFPGDSFGFVVSHHDSGTKVELLGIERILDTF